MLVEGRVKNDERPMPWETGSIIVSKIMSEALSEWDYKLEITLSAKVRLDEVPALRGLTKVACPHDRGHEHGIVGVPDGKNEEHRRGAVLVRFCIAVDEIRSVCVAALVFVAWRAGVVEAVAASGSVDVVAVGSVEIEDVLGARPWPPG